MKQAESIGHPTQLCGYRILNNVADMQEAQAAGPGEADDGSPAAEEAPALQQRPVQPFPASLAAPSTLSDWPPQFVGMGAPQMQV